MTQLLVKIGYLTGWGYCFNCESNNRIRRAKIQSGFSEDDYCSICGRNDIVNEILVTNKERE